MVDSSLSRIDSSCLVYANRELVRVINQVNLWPVTAVLHEALQAQFY